MATDLNAILEILKVVASIIAALRDMGLKVSGEVSVADLLKLIPTRG